MNRLLALFAVLVVNNIAVQADVPSAAALKHFETAVRPILIDHCHKCHGPKQQRAGLRLDSRDALLKGGDTGPAVVPGKPAESLLVLAVRQEGDDLKMPPEEKLTDRQIADLVKWVEHGAPFPASTVAPLRSRDPNHWAFQPPGEVAVPAVKHTAWPQTAVDRFILAKLEAHQLEPSPPADKRTLIRRVTFDLIGLPPTPADIESFLADHRPDAFARLVDRLLDSPAYGERWGRHWLDVARYADSNGLDENVAHGNAWRYRDYIVAAFNSDKPFNRFVIEQLAGDLLPFAEQQVGAASRAAPLSAADEAQRHELLIATGFLGIGPKVLAEVDEAKMQMDIVDEQIDTTGRAFLGLTLGCARCHDHKFDPIDTADYYGLAGIFKSTRTMEHFKKVARWHENVLPSPAAAAALAMYQANIAGKKLTIQELVVQADNQARLKLAADAKPPESLESLYSDENKAALKKLRAELTTLEKTPPDLPSAMGATEDRVADEPIHVRGNPLKLGDVVARHTPPVLRGPAPAQFSATESGRLQLANWLVDPRHPLTARVLANRVWRWHFGKGLVRTTDNFGLLGEAPTHPELLDWLARRFIAEGWSMKSLHRLIANSATYQQRSCPGHFRVSGTLARNDSHQRPGLSEASRTQDSPDPDNLLYTRFDLRRLEAEELRDALLAVSGRLDRTVGGSLLTVKNRAYFFDHTSKDLTDYSSPRRSLYLPVVRNNVYEVFQLLDYPDAAVSSSDRTTTTVAPQALLMLNSDLVLQSAEGFADRLLSEPGDDATRMQRMYVIAYGREATEAEIAANRKLLREVEQALRSSPDAANERRRQAWSALCQVVLVANEFVYVE